MVSNEMRGVREAIEELMVAEGMQDMGLLLRIRERWEELVGEEAAAKTRPYRLEKGKLFVGAGSHALAQDLHYRIEGIIDGIKASLGVEIKSVVVKKINLK